MKYAEPNAYEIETRRELTAAAAELLAGVAIADAPIGRSAGRRSAGDRAGGNAALPVLASFLSADSRCRQRLCRSRGGTRSSTWACVIAAATTRFRATFCAGQRFRFDILMDIGGFRDMHRHRRCVQIMQDYTTAHGYDDAGRDCRRGTGPALSGDDGARARNSGADRGAKRRRS